MAVALAFRPLRARIGAWLFGGVAVFGLATIGVGLSTALAPTIFFLVVSGAADMLSVTVRHTLIQVATPDAMRGRVLSPWFSSTPPTSWANSSREWPTGGERRAIVVGGVGTVAVVLA
jgi:hypothetical protein